MPDPIADLERRKPGGPSSRERSYSRNEIEAAMRLAAGDAVLAHKRLELPLVEWRDGRVVSTPPEEIDP
ncbi:MAG: hypothetical protein AAF790_00470 [Planctomycetota bacterium]